MKSSNRIRPDLERRCYLAFKNTIPLQEFSRRLNALNNGVSENFVRACLLYRQAQKCFKCEPSIAMVLLCSTAEAMLGGSGKSARHKYKKFLLDNCPTNYRQSPIKVYPNRKPPKRPASFEESLNYIYSKFRNVYLHEGVGRISKLPKSNYTNWIAHSLCDLDENKKDEYYTNLLDIFEWFSKVIIESLNTFLMKDN